MEYDKRHRTFLQALIQAGILLEQDAKALCVKIFDENLKISTIAEHLNDKLSPLAMQMKSGLCELTGDKYWSIVGTIHEEAIKIPSQFTQSQRAFLRLVYSELIGSNDGCISSTDCLNISNNVETKFSMGEADQFLKILIKQKWLHIRDGYIYMGIRSIIELLPYFRVTYQEHFKKCHLCKEVIFHGFKCENCNIICHYYCLMKYSKNQKNIKCPQCSHNIDINLIPDEATAFEILNQSSENESMDASERTNSSQLSSGKRRSRTINQSSENESMNASEETNSSQLSSGKRRSRTITRVQ